MDARFIDFHSHFYDRAWFSSPTMSGQGVLARAWPMLTDIEAQLAAMDSASIDAKVLSAPTALLVEPGKHLTPTLMQRINDRFAELVSTYPERLLSLATIDAFQGEVAAREVERAIQKLGLEGICVDCALGRPFPGRARSSPNSRSSRKTGCGRICPSDQPGRIDRSPVTPGTHWHPSGARDGKRGQSACAAPQRYP